MNRKLILSTIASVFIHSLISLILVTGSKLNLRSAQAIEVIFKNQEMNPQPLAEANSQFQAQTTSKAAAGAESSVRSLDKLGVHVVYPRVSRILKEEGRVVIRVHGSEKSGSAARIQISSGYPRLDEAALKATEQALNTGVIKMYAGLNPFEIPYVFRLTDASRD